MNCVTFQSDDCIDKNLINFPFPVEIHTNRFGKNTFTQKEILSTNNFNKDNLYLLDTKDIFLKKRIKVFLYREPSSCYKREDPEDVVKYKNLYNLILTTDDFVLKNTDNAKLFLCGTTLFNVPENSSILLGEIEDSFEGFNIKKFNSISFLKTHKFNTDTVEGYKIRNELWNNTNKILNTKNFYVSSKKITVFSPSGLITLEPEKDDRIMKSFDKKDLFESKFSIIIENCKDKNYFSEKLIDCLLCKTIPIFWGCDNIGDFFDTRGFIICKDADDIINKSNNLNIEKEYDKLKKYIDINFELSKKYALNYTKRVELAIKEHVFGIT